MAGLKIYACFLALSLMSAEPGFGDVIFHNGSTDSCQGCHTTPPLLTGSDPSSTCLRCHAVSGAPQNVKSSDGSSFTPGGDFYWLGKTFTWSAGFNVTTTSPGYSINSTAITAGRSRIFRDNYATNVISWIECCSCNYSRYHQNLKMYLWPWFSEQELKPNYFCIRQCCEMRPILPP